MPGVFPSPLYSVCTPSILSPHKIVHCGLYVQPPLLLTSQILLQSNVSLKINNINRNLNCLTEQREENNHTIIAVAQELSSGPALLVSSRTSMVRLFGQLHCVYLYPHCTSSLTPLCVVHQLTLFVFYSCKDIPSSSQKYRFQVPKRNCC